MLKMWVEYKNENWVKCESQIWESNLGVKFKTALDSPISYYWGEGMYIFFFNLIQKQSSRIAFYLNRINWEAAIQSSLIPLI